MRPVRLAVADDSAFVRMAIVRMLADEPRIEVVGLASSGEELLARLQEWRPDVITLDLAMPGMGGLLALEAIVSIAPTPVIILSTHAGAGAPQTIEALHRGAVDFVDKQQYSLVDFRSLRQVLLEKILAVAADAASDAARSIPTTGAAEPPRGGPELLVLGSSTGGPPAIEQILLALGSDLPVPLLIAQHMPQGFTRAFAERLNARLPLQVREARGREPLTNQGCVWIAPAGSHLRVTESSSGERSTEVSPRPADAAHRPSVDELFISAARTVGAGVVGVLLTGMGKDGALGLREIVRRGGRAIAQDRASSVVWGMPGAAVAMGAVHEVLPLERIAPTLRALWRSPTAEATGR